MVTCSQRGRVPIAWLGCWFVSARCGKREWMTAWALHAALCVSVCLHGFFFLFLCRMRDVDAGVC